MEFRVRSSAPPARLGILAASFNPPTAAHRELVRAAFAHVDEVVCVLPRMFPHKEYFGATLEQRLDLVEQSDLGPAVSIAVSERGLFVEIARECRAAYGDATELFLLCGADAAERVLTWDYDRPEIAEEMLREFQMLVAQRGQVWQSPPQFGDRISHLTLREDVGHVSSTEVRERIRAGGRWEHLVPEPIVDQVRRIYS